MVLEALRPGLKRLAGRLLIDASRREELWSEITYEVWSRIRTYPVRRRPQRVAANLLLDTLHGVLRAERAERGARAQIGFEPLDAPPPASAWTAEDPPGDTTDVVRLVGRAVDGGAISREEAELILQSRVAGVSLGELAQRRQISFDALKHRRARAERRLLLFLGLRVPSAPGKGRSLSARVTGAGPSPLTGERTNRT